jgi:hypothetical protein
MGYSGIGALNSLTSASGQRIYEHAIREFIGSTNRRPPVIGFMRRLLLTVQRAFDVGLDALRPRSAQGDTPHH